METYSYWFLLALLLLGLEMATTTFYLLVLSVAMAVAGLAAMLAASMAWQLQLCALTVIAGNLFLRRWKKSQVAEAWSLDVGQPVQVLTWHENGTARVMYRGAGWDAWLDAEEAREPACLLRDGIFYIKAIRGSSLILTHHKHL